MGNPGVLAIPTLHRASAPSTRSASPTMPRPSIFTNYAPTISTNRAHYKKTMPRAIRDAMPHRSTQQRRRMAGPLWLISAHTDAVIDVAGSERSATVLCSQRQKTKKQAPTDRTCSKTKQQATVPNRSVKPPHRTAPHSRFVSFRFARRPRKSPSLLTLPLQLQPRSRGVVGWMSS